MSTPEEEFDYENDESWYEDAMNALDSPANNHGTIYTEEEIAELSDYDKTIISYRNSLLQNGFEYMDLQNGDYIMDIIGRSGTIHYAACNFVLAYKKESSYITLSQLHSADDNVVNPVQLAAVIFVNKHLGSYQFLEFFHLEEELQEDQKDMNCITINREFTYKEKPSLEFYKSDDIKVNEKYIGLIEELKPEIFEFINEYIILELSRIKFGGSSIEKYIEVIENLQD